MPKLLVALLIASGVVHAECYTRSAASVSAASRIERVTDLTQTILPAEGKQVRCRVTFRALIDNVWHTAEGEALGPAGSAGAQVCSQALNSGTSFFRLQPEQSMSYQVSNSDMIWIDSTVSGEGVEVTSEY